MTTKKNTSGGDRDELDRVGDERAVAEDSVVDRERELAEIGLADQHRDDRQHEILDERVDERSEREAEHEGDRQLDDVAPQKEVLELFEHGTRPYNDPRAFGHSPFGEPLEWRHRPQLGG